MSLWYVVFSRPRQEKVAKANLDRQGFRTYLPMIKHPKRRRGRWVDVIEPLFPRYLFIELEFGEQDISPVRSTFGVVDFVRFGLWPASAPGGFVESLIADEDPVLACHCIGTQPFKQGDRVTIVAGPLAGTSAIFEEPTGEGRVALLLELLGRTNRVMVDRNEIVLDT
jgi:transcriptional antiterminator RfaH